MSVEIPLIPLMVPCNWVERIKSDPVGEAKKMLREGDSFGDIYEDTAVRSLLALVKKERAEVKRLRTAIKDHEVGREAELAGVSTADYALWDALKPAPAPVGEQVDG